MERKSAVFLTILLLLVTCVFVTLWILSPDSNWEPWATLISSVAIPIVAFWDKIMVSLKDKEQYHQERSLSNQHARRTEYLKYIEHDIENKLKASIHSARFIDLGLIDSPSSTYLPWVYKDSNTKLEFDNINSAFDHYNGRMLLLGNPGSGKTTTMLHIAKELTQKALQNINEPIPLVLNLSKFKFEMKKALFRNKRGHNHETNETSNSTEIERWMVSEFIRFPGINSNIASQWIIEGKIAVFFDGLDEVDDQHRAKLVELLNATFLRRYSNHITLVCSRINEYLPFQQEKEKRLHLDGAITLQPLDEEQIIRYLEQTKSTGLIDALYVDESIKEMAKTPLMLSMMSLAYGSSAPYDLNAKLSITERRHQLMESYVSKMLQRKERRERNIPFDENPENDVSVKEYQYSPEKINKYLGWLAIRMSVRMQTAFSLKTIYNFFIIASDRDKNSLIWLMTSMSKGFVILISFILCCLIYDHVLFFNSKYSLILMGLIFFGTILNQWLQIKKNPVKRSQTRLNEFKEAIVILILFPSVILILPLISIASERIVPNADHLSSGLIVFILIASFLIFLRTKANTESNFDWDLYDRKTTAWVFYFNFITTICAIIIQLFGSFVWDNFWYYVVGLNVAFSVFFYGKTLTFDRKINLDTIIFFILPMVAIILISVFMRQFLPVVQEIDIDIFLFLFYIHFLLAKFYKFPLLHLISVAFAITLGKLILGYIGVIISLLLIIILILVLEILGNDKMYNKEFKQRIKSRRLGVQKLIDKFILLESKFILSPINAGIMVFFRCQPQNRSIFYQYCQNCLLIKTSTKDFEFTHRMIRDYFSLRELQPALHSGNKKQKLEAIRNLGYQGDASVDALIEFANDSNADTREAAQTGLGKIASPAVVDYIELGLQDKAASVRIQAVKSAKHPNIDPSSYTKILLKMLEDPVLEVQLITIDQILKEDLPYSNRPLIRVAGLVEKNDAIAEHVNKYIVQYGKNDARIVRSCIKIAQLSKDKRFVKALIKILRNSSFTNSAIYALGEIADPTALEILKKYLNKRDKNTRLAASEAIQRIISKN